MRRLSKIGSHEDTKNPPSARISNIRLDFEVFDLLKITVFQAMMRIASRQCFQKNGDFVYSSAEGVHSPVAKC